MTYVAGQRANLRTTVTDLTGAPADATVVLTITAPDGTVTTPAVNHPSTGNYNADVTFDQAGDWLRVWSTTGAVVSSDVDQVHVITPALRIVGLAEVKEHGNITSAASDRELLDFIGTAQQMIEDKVGAVVPRTLTDVAASTAIFVSPVVYTVQLEQAPVLSVTSVVEYGSTLSANQYAVDLKTGALTRLGGRGWYASAAYPLTVVYRAGRSPIPEGIRWAAKDLTIHLWRSSQALRGGRARPSSDDAPASAAAFGLPNRVRDALVPFLLPDLDVY